MFPASALVIPAGFTEPGGRWRNRQPGAACRWPFRAGLQLPGQLPSGWHHPGLPEL